MIVYKWIGVLKQMSVRLGLFVDQIIMKYLVDFGTNSINTHGSTNETIM